MQYILNESEVERFEELKKMAWYYGDLNNIRCRLERIKPLTENFENEVTHPEEFTYTKNKLEALRCSLIQLIEKLTEQFGHGDTQPGDIFSLPGNWKDLLGRTVWVPAEVSGVCAQGGITVKVLGASIDCPPCSVVVPVADDGVTQTVKFGDEVYEFTRKGGK